ncbi:MAG TPA: hypothetical protein DCE41_25545 [Cytophagales bacterium]|nr:hypothetical protein [Cytophagales bacterium]HAA19904.1 hypothetical protein [Cytophagales bacterium]HAP62668.1 hypothetical protein [Cytophagales bacterium]
MKSFSYSTASLLLLLWGCTTEPAPPFNPESGVVEGQTFTETLLVDGHVYDGLIIRNCLFTDIEGDGLQLRDVDEVQVINCTFHNISEDAIRFRNSGTTENVQITDNTISQIGHNGILGPEGHTGTLLSGNTIYEVGLDNTSTLAGAPHHGIYWQGTDFTIQNNVIYEVQNNGGNAISVRTWGTIASNYLHHATDHGISYFSDHPGEGELLRIENNVIYDNGARAITLTSNGNAANHIGGAIIRFNTLLTSDQATIGIDNDLTGLDFSLRGNIVLRTDGSTGYVFTEVPFTESHNYTGSGDIGFESFSTRNFDLRSSSDAVGFATGLSDFPTTDILGRTRIAERLDPGAYTSVE